jgi:hypothetical protein
VSLVAAGHAAREDAMAPHGAPLAWLTVVSNAFGVPALYWAHRHGREFEAAAQLRVVAVSTLYHAMALWLAGAEATRPQAVAFEVLQVLDFHFSIDMINVHATGMALHEHPESRATAHLLLSGFTLALVVADRFAWWSVAATFAVALAVCLAGAALGDGVRATVRRWDLGDLLWLVVACVLGVGFKIAGDVSEDRWRAAGSPGACAGGHGWLRPCLPESVGYMVFHSLWHLWILGVAPWLAAEVTEPGTAGAHLRALLCPRRRRITDSRNRT